MEVERKLPFRMSPRAIRKVQKIDLVELQFTEQDLTGLQMATSKVSVDRNTSADCQLHASNQARTNNL